MIAITMAATLSFVVIVNNYDDDNQIKNFTYAFLGIIFFLVVIELAGIVLSLELFERQLI